MPGPIFNPGLQASQQAAQQARQSAQCASDQAVRFQRSQYGGPRPARRPGTLRTLGRVVFFVVWLAVAAVIVGGAILVLNGTGGLR